MDPINQEKKTQNGRLLVISGPSGSGKSTLTREAVRRTNAKISISATTRKPGLNETEGVDYYFLTENEFLEKIAAGEFLEHARVFGHYYGTPAAPVEERLQNGLTILLEIDVQGARQVFKRYPEAIGILVVAPDSKTLRERLCGRGREKEDIIKKRLEKAEWERQEAESLNNFKHIIINDKIEQAIDELVKIIKPT